ncbi:MAG: hypothetical protein QM796_18625 [Chthoniobacteraceae bacterium]
MKRNVLKERGRMATYWGGIAVVINTVLLLPLAATGPGWWYERGIIATDSNTGATKVADDYGAINQGQLKMLATTAYNELAANCPGGIGDMTAPNGTGYKLMLLINSWSTPQSGGGRVPIVTANTDDYAAVNLGQLKTVAQPFYTRLLEVGYGTDYPWNAPGHGAADDYALANIGQAKYLFSFDLTGSPNSYDSNGDGVPDWWELENFGTIYLNLNYIPDGDGLTIAQKYALGLPIGKQNNPTLKLQVNVIAR